MRSSHVREQDYRKVETDASSLLALIERGIACLEQGRHVEGAGLSGPGLREFVTSRLLANTE